MLFSINKLRDLANLDKQITNDQIIDAINKIGFEVESVKNFLNVSKIKFGLIKKVYKNPNASNLNVCEIEFEDKMRIIQTTAQNVEQNKYIVAFVENSTFGKIKIEAKEIKGTFSQGMLCSLEELGFDKSLIRDEFQDKIFLLDKADLKQDPIDFFDLDDQIVDVSILSNRSDANGYFIMALELSAFFETKTNFEIKNEIFKIHPNLKVDETNTLDFVLIEPQKELKKISLKDQILIMKSNIKTFNDSVDLTNLNLIMNAMPTHVYDKDKISNEISVKKVSQEVSILGNKKISLDNNLVVCSKEKPISIAGVIGIADFGSDQNTKNFVFEIGRFKTLDIQKSIKSVKLDTQSSKLSSKKISSGTFKMALNFLTSYFDSQVLVSKNLKDKKESFNFVWEDLNKFLNTDVKKMPHFNRVLKSLNILGFEFKDNKVYLPTYRHDIEHVQDILEEFLRFYGYENLVFEAPNIKNFETKNYEEYLNFIPYLNYSETRTYSLVSKDKNIFNPFNFKENINLETFHSKEREQIRNSMILSMEEVLQYNLKRKVENVNIFEIGIINNSQRSLALLSNQKSFNRFKEDVESILKDKLYSFEKGGFDFSHPLESIIIKDNDQLIGYIIRANAKNFEEDFVYAEILIDKLRNKKIENKSLNYLPLKTLDINFEVPSENGLFEVYKTLEKNEKIYSYKLIDHYQKNQISIYTIRIWAFEENIEELKTLFNL
ncbi:phenylalanine--tRNA ligase subunit beta [Mycoplasmopsis pulmonis]|uniref:phenylalanine--tRNA ligase subunit beta n=1 Tax=Mycoplasmopsis pulmonis TaxID=2107 RepID=UPI001004FFF5|nr:phenylalanine--tRNA ligase subunit beta [Mycoplasmopsis pulmonis]VEU68110.1 Phenylalanine--tRNA ligase beta subunit [Mycoplasmopsis pulmonis]